MASHVVVIDSSFRRTVVKVTPGTFMTDVLEEACSKFKFNATNYGLRNNNKPVDLSRNFRQTGLASGAKLELVAASRTPSAVQVALQLPESISSSVPGGRLIEKFASNTTVWKILRTFEEKQKGSNLNFTARGVTELDSGASGAGRIYYEMPSVNAMNRELSTFGDLQKTLAQLGLNSGSCLLRLSFKKTNQPLEEAMKDIGTYFKEENEAPPLVKSEVAEPPKQASEEQLEQIQSPPAAAPSNTKDVEMTSAPEISTEEPPATVVVGTSERTVSVFSPPSANMPQAALQPHNEADYEPSIVHAKLHQARLQNNSHNKRLLSDAEMEQLEREKAAKLSATTKVSIKVRFPDQSTVVSDFTSAETALDLYKFVSASIVAEDQPFKLVYTGKGTVTIPRDESKLLIRHLGLQGRVLANFHWEDEADPKVRRQPILKPHLREKAQEVKVPVAPIVEEEKGKAGSSIVDDSGKGKDGEGEKKPKGGVPKWLKLGKK